MTSTITFFENAFDNAVTDECMEQFEWDELVQFFEDSVVISDDKNSLGFVWAKYNTVNPVEFAPVSNTDPTLKLHKSTGKPMARRKTENIIEYYGLCLDYDGGASLSDVKACLAGIRHFGYTSFNHVIKGVDKFRILIPFSNACPHQEFRARVKSFKAEFAGTDPQTFDSSRIFYAPNVSAANLDHFDCWSGDGEALDWTMFEEAFEPPASVRDPIVSQYRLEGSEFSTTGNGRVDWASFNILQFASDAGLNPKPAGRGKWNVVCPRLHEHSSNTPGGTVIYDKALGDPHFYCSHSHGSSWFFDHYAEEFNTRGWKRLWCEKLVTTTTEQQTK